MPHAPSDGARLYYEETGSGYPIVFVHEFAADHLEWEGQVRWFARDYRCITFNARGYPPSDVPTDSAAYGQGHAADDIAAVMRHLGIAKAHIVGLSMGASATLHFGLRHAAMASALVAAGVGAGAFAAHTARFKTDSVAMAERLEREGFAEAAKDIAHGPTRIQLKNKDPRGWREFLDHLSAHSAAGSAMTLRYYQAQRPSLFDFEAEFKRMTIPTLLICGDEDEPCLETNLFLKRAIPTAGLWFVPQTGHCVNLEEPDFFNRAIQDFFGRVERGRWRPRDPVSVPGVASSFGSRS
jgi:pimeloyl-ACP methyl ester carboxylesterase